jgi:hypothetical protein
VWDGIVVEATAGGVISSKPTVAPYYSEISHSVNGLVVESYAAVVGSQPSVQLRYVYFLHNENQGLSVASSGGIPLTGTVEDCLFDSDPRQMQGPWKYTSAQDLHVSRRHISLSGGCSGLTVRRNTLDHALFGIWTTGNGGFIGTDNVIRNFYITGLYAVDLFNSAYQLTGNRFYFPPAENEISASGSPQLRAAFASVQQPANFARLIEGACVGLYGPSVAVGSSSFALDGNQFLQATLPAAYANQISYPQYGVVIKGGRVENNVFQNLYLGYHSLSTQQGGIIKGNLFLGCYKGLVIRNGLDHSQTGGAGAVTVSCNTFRRPVGPSGESFGMIRELCQRQALSEACDKVELSFLAGTSTPNLLKNFFTDDRLAANVGLHVFYHVANHVEDGATNPLVYHTFPDKVSSIVYDPAKVTVTGFLYPTTDSRAIDCGDEGYTNGLQFRPANSTALAVTSAATALSEKERYWLAQNVPNPCAGSTSISYRIPAGEQGAMLVIRDFISGKVLYQQALHDGEHTLSLSLQGLQPGPYHYALEISGRSVARHNLLVQ